MSDGTIAATGEAEPGVPAHVTSADPRLALSMELTPLTASGQSAAGGLDS